MIPHPIGRPSDAPEKIPLWAWHLEHWMRTGRKGPRPAGAPRRTPMWFWHWRAWGLRRARRAGHKQWHRHVHRKTTREKIVHHWYWGAAQKVSPQIHYTMDSRRDDWLVNKEPTALPMWTDCSGWTTQGYYTAGAPDPNGLAYRFLGYTGTALSNAYAHGTVTTDLRKAKPGDTIVVGDGTGVHEVGVVEADPVGGNPRVSSHGREGVQIGRALDDPREPKRVCQVLA